MASEGSPFGGFNPALIPAGLLALALLFAVLSFVVGWFAVTTRIQIWEYDAEDPEGKGNFSNIPSVRVHTEFELLQLNSRIEPRNIERGLEERSDLPSYERDMDQTGSKMLGLFLLNIVTFVSLAAAAGLYFWQRKGSRNFSRSIWRFGALFLGFAIFSLLYLYSQVPAAARTDTREVLEGYEVLLRSNPEFPDIDKSMLQPNVQFWNRWVCCPPASHFVVNGREYLVVVTTESHPSAGFWLVGGAAVLAGAAVIMAARAGELGPGPREPQAPKPPELYPTYKAA